MCIRSKNRAPLNIAVTNHRIMVGFDPVAKWPQIWVVSLWRKNVILLRMIQPSQYVTTDDKTQRNVTRRWYCKHQILAMNRSIDKRQIFPIEITLRVRWNSPKTFRIVMHFSSWRFGSVAVKVMKVTKLTAPVRKSVEERLPKIRYCS